MDRETFIDLFKSLDFVDRQSWMSAEEWNDFRTSPQFFLVRTSDEKSEALWTVVLRGRRRTSADAVSFRAAVPALRRIADRNDPIGREIAGRVLQSQPTTGDVGQVRRTASAIADAIETEERT